MQVLVNNRNEIISYAIIGGFEDGIDIETFPANFSQVFRPKVFKYSNGMITFNDNYSEEKEDLHNQIDIGKNTAVAYDDSLRKMVASMQKQVVQSTMLSMQANKQNAKMAQQIVKLEKTLADKKGDDKNA